MAYTGVRSVEVQRARIGDIRSNGHTKLEVIGKGEVDPGRAVVLMHPELLGAINDWLRIHPRRYDLDAPLFCSLSRRNLGGALDMSTIRRLVKGYFEQAGIVSPRKTTHSLRHTVVTIAKLAGVPDTKIMSMTGHKSRGTLDIYTHEIDRDTDPAEGYISYD